MATHSLPVLEPAQPAIDRAGAMRMLFNVAWMSLLLGLLAQAAVILGLLLFDVDLGGTKEVARDTLKSVTWPLLVCLGVATGKVLALRQPALSQAQAMAVTGAIAAPLGLTAARLLHRAFGEALSLGPRELAIGLFATLALMKVLQYGFIGAALGRVQTNPNSHWVAALAVGLVADLIFGTAALVALAAGKTMQTGDWISNGVNEMLVPVGCALIVYAVDRLGRPGAT